MVCIQWTMIFVITVVVILWTCKATNFDHCGDEYCWPDHAKPLSICFLGQYWGQIKPFLGAWLRSWHLDASNVFWTMANWLIRLWQYCQLWWKTPDSLTASLQSEVQMGMCKFRGFTYFSHKQLPIEHKGGCAWKNWKV